MAPLTFRIVITQEIRVFQQNPPETDIRFDPMNGGKWQEAVGLLWIIGTQNQTFI
ncbi:MAG: hypothetical protein ACLPID_11595 [Beijerinckiaceae bacterium]